MTSLTPYLPLDTVAWPLHKDGVTLDVAAWSLHKNDMHDLRWVVFLLSDTEVWLAQGWHAQIQGFFPCEELTAPCSRMTRTNRVVWRRVCGSNSRMTRANRVLGRREHGPCAKMTSLIRDTVKISLTYARGDTQNRV